MTETSQTPTAQPRRLARRYRLDRELGSGAMGTVWHAQDEVLRRAVAVKEVRLQPGLSADERAIAIERTLREARAIAALSHPNVVTLFDVIDEDDRPWVVMELVPAKSLGELLDERGPLTPAEASRIGLAVLGALRAAHEVGITHRDVKPGNILVSPDGRVKLTDFGIARNQGDSSLTSTGLLVGSPSYVSPEVARGREAGPPADVWSLGATLHAMVEGSPPFDAGDPVSTLAAVVGDPPAATPHAGPLAPIIARMLEKDPVRRLTTEAARDLLTQVASGALAAPRPGFRPLGGPPMLLAPPPGLPPGHPSGPSALPPGSTVGGRRPVPAPGLNPANASQATSTNRVVPGGPAARPPGPGAPGGRPPGYATGVLPAVPGGPPAGPPSAPGGPPTTGPPPGGRARNRRTALIVVLVAILVAALGTGGFFVVRALNAEEAPPTDPTGVNSSPAPSDDATDQPTPEPSVPDGYVSVEDDLGFTVNLPENWNEGQNKSNSVYYLDPSGVASIQFVVDEPTDKTALGCFEDQADQDGGPQDLPGFHQLRLREVDYADYPSAAEWEFTHLRDGPRNQVMWFAFLENDDVRWSFLLSAPQPVFNQFAPVLNEVKQSFDPA